MAHKRIHIEKVAENPGGFPSNPKDRHEPGVGQDPNFSLPIDYWIEGLLLNDIEVGSPVSVMRDIRNGIQMYGFFASSPVTELTETQFKTRNSVYNYRYLDNLS